MPMTFKQSKNYLDTLTITKALWWFIENVCDGDESRNEVFFYLRERMRTET